MYAMFKGNSNRLTPHKRKTHELKKNKCSILKCKNKSSNIDKLNENAEVATNRSSKLRNSLLVSNKIKCQPKICHCTERLNCHSNIIEIKTSYSNSLMERISMPSNMRRDLSTTKSIQNNGYLLEKSYELAHNKTKCNEYGSTQGTDAMNFKYIGYGKECSVVFKKTFLKRNIRIISVFGLVLLMITSSVALPAPAQSTETRSSHADENSVKGYLETFGYLPKGRPEVANLVHADAAQSYEDEFRIALKTLQEYGGIPVTGKVDEATKKLLTKRRCGRPDREPDEDSSRRKKRFVVLKQKWEHTNLTWSLSTRHLPTGLDPYETRSVLAEALSVWEQESRFTFTEINSDRADIVVSFARRDHNDSYPFDGRGAVLAHAFYPGSGRGGDAHFDDDELWLLQTNDDDEDGTSLLAVAAHEFGHSLGLGHSQVQGALMFPWYQGIQPDFKLPEDDRNGIQQMYGPKEDKKLWGRIPFYQPRETPTTVRTTTPSTTTHRHHPHHHPMYTPDPRPPNRYPYHTERPIYTYYPERRPHDPNNHPRRTNHHHPRPTIPETTTHPTTNRPRYPTSRPNYPYPRPNLPTDPRQDPRYRPKKKPYYPVKTTPAKPTARPNKPDTCDTTYDAVSLIRGELFIFKDAYHWRIGANGRYNGYPTETYRMWPNLPNDLTHVDAVYERLDKKIVFFIGKQFYLFDGQHLVSGYPQPLTYLGLPSYLEKIDAAMVWGHNQKTYFYSGHLYWKFDDEEGRVELDYPRDMSMWKGVGYNIDSVFQWKDGKTYFFKGKGFWKFNDLKMAVEHERPLASASYWMGCPFERPGQRSPYKALPAPGSTLRSPKAASASSRIDHNISAISYLLIIIYTVKYFLVM